MRPILLLYCLILSFLSFGQKDVNLIFHLDKSTFKAKSRKDSSGYQRSKEKALTTFRLEGYLGIQIQDSTAKGNNIHYRLKASHRFSKIKLNCVNARKEDLDREKNMQSLARNLNDRITGLENKGYPFSSIQIVSQEEDENKLKVNYRIDSGDYVYIDKIHIKSEDKVHEKTLLNLINLKISDAYNEAKIRDVEEILNNSPYFKLKRSPEVLFRKGKAEVFLYVDKKKSSNADGFIGFNQDKNTNKFVLNGNVNLSLKNALNRTESLALSWKSNPDKTQNFRSSLKYPFIFNSPIGIGAKINLQKQ
ncbi:hypothetical protein JYT25_00750, partial [bacterium AH-315-C20]|nr:hypothetical protein [bacterium AH-315-C20]